MRRLETAAMRRWLARRRWLRAGHLVRATLRYCTELYYSINELILLLYNALYCTVLHCTTFRIKRLRAEAGEEQGPGFLSSLEEVWI